MLKKYSILFIMLCIFIFGCTNNHVIINNINDLEGKKVGIYTGSEYDQILTKKIQNAIPTYYNSYTDEVMALKSGKIDAFLADEPLAKEILKNFSDLKMLDSYLTKDSYAFAINPKKKNLQKEINNIIEVMIDDGTLEKMKNKWFDTDEDKKILEKYDCTKCNKTLKFATVAGSAPFAYMKNNEIVGYDIDIINYIGAKLGYKVEIIEMSFDGIIPALKSGKVDVAGCSIIVTEERKKSVLFSLPNYTGGIVIVTRKD